MIATTIKAGRRSVWIACAGVALAVAGAAGQAEAKTAEAAPPAAAPATEAAAKATAPAAPAETTRFTAKIYDRANRAGAPIFLYANESKIEGTNKHSQNVFTTPTGKEVAAETIDIENGKLKSYEQRQFQVGTVGKVDIKGNEVVFTLIKGGKTKTGTEPLKDNFVVGPTLISYLQARWPQVLKGDVIDVRIGVPDRLETVGFSLKKIKDVDYKGQKAVVVKMKPTSMIIAALVNPVHFTLAADGSRLLELDGRMVPKKEEGGRLKDLDAVAVYEYP